MQRPVSLVLVAAEAGVALLFVLAALAAPAQAAPKEELEELRGRIGELQKQLADSEESKAEAGDALRESERAVSETNRKLYQLAEQRRQVNAALTKLRSRARTVEADIAAEQATLSSLLYQQYVTGQSDAVKLVLNREDPNEIARQLHYLGYVSRARAELLASLRYNLANLEKLADETRDKSAELRALQNEEASQKRRLEKEKAERQHVYSRVSSEIAQSRKQLSTLKRDEERLTRLIERLAKEVARKKPGKRITNQALPSADSGSGPFRKLKGRLRLPVLGELTNRFGSQRKDSGREIGRASCRERVLDHV